MKKLLIIPLMLIMLMGTAQDKGFFLFGYSELADKNTHTDAFDYGFNLGFGIEYQMTVTYFKAETYWFPDLNGIDYIDYKGTVGLNHHFGYDDKHRVYSGFKAGVIHRNWKGGHMLIGLELGYEYRFNDFSLGVQFYHEHKKDDKFTNANATGHNVNSVAIKFSKEL